MNILAEFCKVTTSEEYPQFFYSFPANIRKEVIDEVTKLPTYKDVDPDKVLGRDFKKRRV